MHDGDGLSDYQGRRIDQVRFSIRMSLFVTIPLLAVLAAVLYREIFG